MNNIIVALVSALIGAVSTQLLASRKIKKLNAANHVENSKTFRYAWERGVEFGVNQGKYEAWLDQLRTSK